MGLLTTADIRSTEFGVSRKGYDMDEIDAFVDAVCESVAGLTDELSAAKNELESLRADNVMLVEAVEEADGRAEEAEKALSVEKYENESALAQAVTALEVARESHSLLQSKVDDSNARSGVAESVDLLASAHKTAEDAIARAHDTANNLMEAAELYSKETRENADVYSSHKRADAETEVVELERQGQKLRSYNAEYRSQIISVLRSATEFIEGSLTLDTVPHEVDSDDVNDGEVFTED